MKKCDALKCYQYNGSAMREGVVVQGLATETDITTLLGLAGDLTNQTDITENITVPSAKPNVEQINQLNIMEVCLVDAWVSPSQRKLFIKGLIKQKAMYTACLPVQSMHTVENEQPFSHFIDIAGLTDDQLALLQANPENYVALAVEDAFIQIQTGRELFKNVIVAAFILVDLLPAGTAIDC